MVIHFLTNFAIAAAVIPLGTQSSMDLKSIDDQIVALANESSSARMSLIAKYKQEYLNTKSLNSVFRFVDSTYRLLDGISPEKTLSIRKEAYGVTKTFKAKDRYFTGAKVGLAVEIGLEKDVIEDAAWLMKSFPDQSFFRYRYLQCAVLGADSHKNSKTFLMMSGQLVKAEPNTVRYLILDAFLNNVYADSKDQVRLAIQKYETCLTHKLTSRQLEYVNFHLASARKSIGLLKK